MIPSWVVFHYILNLNEICNTVLPEGQGLTWGSIYEWLFSFFCGHPLWNSSRRSFDILLLSSGLYTCLVL